MNVRFPQHCRWTRWRSQNRIADVGSCGQYRQMANELQPELRSLTGRLGEDLDQLRPVCGSFCHALRAEVGVKGEEGADGFEFYVCSPEWLQMELENNSLLPGRSRLIANRFEPQAVKQYVITQLHHAKGADWNAVTRRLGLWSNWEFEGADR